MKRSIFLAAIAGSILSLAHGTARAQSHFALTSAAFNEGATIPAEYACAGANRSPALAWSGAPATTAAFVLIVEDPDAPGGTFVHWVAYDLPSRAAALSAGLPKSEALPGGGIQGVNSFGRIGYDGPCPPPGSVHHYHFRLLALDAPLKAHLVAQADAAAVEAAAAGHILASTELIGTFSR